MSANVGSMIYVGEKPWHGLGTKYDTTPNSSEEIIKGAKLDWTVSATPMFTSQHDKVMNYHAIYREDDNIILGVVNNQKIKIVQNVETFKSLEAILGKDVDTETVASLGYGEQVFGCFKIKDSFKLFDDEVEHYIVVLNDHLKPDGKITVINTPIRVVCSNTLSAALSSSHVKYRINCNSDSVQNQSVAMFIKESVLNSQQALTRKSEHMFNHKVSRTDLERILDEIFPYIQVADGSSHDRANDRTAMLRETFLTQCMDADNLQNFKGTHYQVFNALADYTQHYYNSSDVGIDLEARMKALPGLSTDYRISRYMKLASNMTA